MSRFQSAVFQSHLADPLDATQSRPHRQRTLAPGLSLWALFALGCWRTPDPPPAVQPGDASVVPTAAAEEASSQGTWQPSPEEKAVYQALASRDAAPSCAVVEALSSTPDDTLLAMVEHVTMPPYVGIRAASCLIDGAGVELIPALVGWVTDPATAGLATLVLTEIGELPAEVAHPIAEAALAGPHRETALRLLADSTDPALQALCSEAPASPG